MVVVRGGPNLVRGMSTLKDTLDALKIPYRVFGYDSSMSSVVDYAKAIDQWMEQGGGKAAVARSMGIR